jgi:hypothetical protein
MYFCLKFGVPWPGGEVTLGVDVDVGVGASPSPGATVPSVEHAAINSNIAVAIVAAQNVLILVSLL